MDGHGARHLAPVTAPSGALHNQFVSASPGNRKPTLDAWFETYDNPLAPHVQHVPHVPHVRTLFLDASPEITEAITSQAPRSCNRANIASFYPECKKHVSLMFHEGASLPEPTRLSRAQATAPRVATSWMPTTLAARAGALQDLVGACVSARS